MSPQLVLLVAAVMHVESAGALDVNKPGPRGEIGFMQIRPTVVRDLNRIAGRKRFTLDDRKSRSRSVEMFRAYVEHYATAERIGRDPTPEDCARIWNGGPRGYRRADTAGYWQRVRAQLISNGQRRHN